jgi:hypothetical protein
MISTVFAANFPHICVIVLSKAQSLAVALFLDLQKNFLANPDQNPYEYKLLFPLSSNH